MTGWKWIMAKSTYNIAKLKEILQKFLLCGKVTTKFAPKTKSYIHSTWNTNHHKNGKKRTIFFQRRYILKHKRKRHNLKGPRAARSCLVTSKKGLYSWPTTCWVVEFHNLTDEITHTYVSMLFYSEWQLTFNKTLLV